MGDTRIKSIFKDVKSGKYDPARKDVLSEFYKVGKKKHGIEPGIIAKKFGGGLKPTKDPNSRKYKYKWLIKYQDVSATLNDYFGASIARFFIGDRAPKNKVIINSHGDVLLASRFIDGLRTVNDLYGRKNTKKWVRSADEISEFSFMKALGVFLMDSDRNGGNDASIPDSEKPKKLISSGVDFARSMIFYNNFNFLKNDRHIFSQVNNGERLDPSDVVIIATNDWYKMPISIFINDEFIKNLRSIAQIYNDRKTEFEAVISSLVDRVKKIVDKDVLKDYAKKITGSKNLAKGLKKEFALQSQKIVHFALCLELQKSIVEGDILKFKEILESNIELTFLKIKWLKGRGEQMKKNPAPNLLEEYLDSKHGDKPEFKKIFVEVVEKKQKEIIYQKLLEVEKGFEGSVRDSLFELLNLSDISSKKQRKQLIDFLDARVTRSEILTSEVIDRIANSMSKIKVSSCRETPKKQLEKSIKEILKFFDKKDQKESLDSISLVISLAFRTNIDSKKTGIAWVEESLKIAASKLYEMSKDDAYKKDFKLLNCVFMMGKKTTELLHEKIYSKSSKIISR